MSRKASTIAVLLLGGMAVALCGAAPKGVSPVDQRTARVMALHELTSLHLIEFNSRQLGARDTAEPTRDLVERFKDLLEGESWQAKFLKADDALDEADKQALTKIQSGQSEIWETGNDREIRYVWGVQGKTVCVQCHRVVTGPKALKEGDLLGVLCIEFKATQ